jgi:type I restriction enzyme S subunit
MTDTLYTIPQNWQWTTLENVCKLIGGGTPNKKIVEYWNGNIFWASVKDIKGDYLFETVDKITVTGLNNSSLIFVKSTTLFGLLALIRQKLLSPKLLPLSIKI